MIRTSRIALCAAIILCFVTVICNYSYSQVSVFSENFETGAMPSGWTESGSPAWQFVLGNGGSNPSSAHGGTKNALLKDATAGANYNKLSTPELDLSGYSTNTLKFWHTQQIWVSDQDELRIYYKTSSGGAWTLITSYTTSVSAWTQRTVTLPNTNSTYYIAFEGNAMYGYGVCIDDVEIIGENIASATYSSGNIPTEYGFDLTSESSSCPGTLMVNIPAGATITSVDVTYSMTAQGGGWKSEQRSQLRCTSAGGADEASVYSGTGGVAGTQVYNRTGLTIANGVSGGGNISFELHAGRTYGGTGCNTTYNQVNNSTWMVTVYYTLPLNDADSKAEATGSQIAATTISSVNNDEAAEAKAVFNFDITDMGSGDGENTKVTQLLFKPGSSNTADWTDHIQGIKIHNGTGWVTLGAVTITDTEITVPVSTGDLDITDNSSLGLTLYVYLNQSNIVDGAILDFRIDYDNHGFTADATGSDFTSTFGASDIEGNNITVDVLASKLLFVQQPTNVCMSSNISPSVTVKATDTHGATDVDYATNISITATGATLTGSPVSAAPASGVSTYGTLSLSSSASGVTFSASSGALTGATSSSFDVKTSPTVTTTAITNISSTSASSGGNVTSAGLGTVSARGVCWNTGGSPTTADSKTTDGSGTGAYASSITGLSAGQTYYVRAYATNECGTSYGSQESFVSASASSDIISGGNEMSDIDYISRTGASITSTAVAHKVWSITIRDGGAGSDADAFGTELTDITIDKGGSNTVSSWANTIKQAALYDGATEVAEVSVAGESIAFTGMSGANVTASDNGTKTLDLYLTFETTNITDNQQFQFRVSNANVTAATSSSSDFASFTAASSSTTSNAGRIEVTATKLEFETSKPPTQVQLGINFNVTVNALDANNILDLDQNSSITLVLNTGTGSISSTTGLTQSLSSGTYAWTDVQYDTEETFKIEAQHGTLTNAISININCTDVLDIDFESDNGNFTTNGTGTEWEWGVPAAPSINTAHGGSKCWGTDLNSTYNISTENYLLSPIYKTTNTSVEWKYWEAKEIENEASCGWDYILPQYSVNGGGWTNITGKVCSMTPTTWGQQSWVINSLTVGDNIQFRWWLHSDGGVIEEGWYIDDVQFKYVTTVPSAVTLYSTSATAGEQVMYNGARYNNTAPRFAASATNSASFNTFQVELNTAADFSGTSYTQTISGAYSSGVKYNINCNSLSPSLPSTLEAVYFVRVRAAADGGTNWSGWSHNASSQWIYIVGSDNQGMCYTTQWQFDQGSGISTNYGNFISSSNNATSANYQDDYLQIDEGSSSNPVTANGDQALTEGTTFYSGASNNCITVGYYNVTGKYDYHGFRFQSADIPQGATILSASFKPYAHTGSGCGGSANTTNQMILKIRGVNQDNCNAWANNTNSSTGDPKNRLRTTAGINWNIPSGASQQWSSGLLITTAPDITSIVQEIIDRPGYSAGNSIGLIVDHNSGVGNYWRYFATRSASTSYSATLQTTYTNFDNEYQLPDILLASFESDGGTVSWNELVFEDDLSGCGACNIQYQVHNASTDAVLVSYSRGTGSIIDISAAGTTASIYVKVKVKRNNSPKLSKIMLTTNNSILPVELVDFSAECLDDGVLVDWSTATETNNDYFTLEKSTDADDYEIISYVAGSGNSNLLTRYSVVDDRLIDDGHILYYRLSQTDYDGALTVYDPIAISCDNSDESEKIMVKPYLESNFIEVSFSELSDNKCQVFLIDDIGRTIVNKTITINSAYQQLYINKSKLRSGIYNLVIQSKDNIMTQQIVIANH